jgi:hypothetical protein
MKTNAIKYSAISVSFIAGILLFLACGPSFEIENSHYRFFSQEVSHADSYKPFFRALGLLYTGEAGASTLKTDNIGDFRETNIRDWFAFFSQKVSKSDIEQLLYTVRLGEIDSLIFKLQKESFSADEKLQQNSLLRYADKKAAKAFLFYLGYAKRCETVACYAPEWYNPDTTAANPLNNTYLIDSLISGGKRMLEKSANPFITGRYIFQLTRLYYLGKHYSSSIELYTKNRSKLNGAGSVQYRAMGYAAASLLKLKRIEEANYFYSLIYDNCPEMKVTAYVSFSPREESDWAACLALAKNNREKTVLWQLLGVRYDAGRAMEAIYQTDPTSDLLDLLLVRTVNKIEEQAVPQRNSFEAKNSSFAINRFNTEDKTAALIRKIADEHKVTKPYVWDLSYGYISFLQGENERATTYLDKAGTEAPADDKMVSDQIHLIKIGMLINGQQKVTPVFEQAALRELQWLKSKRPDYDDAVEAIPYGGVYQWVLGRLSEIYAASGDYTKAECLHYSENALFYQSNEKMESMLALMRKTNRTDFEEFVLAIYPFSYNDICEYQGIRLFYAGDIKGALNKLTEGMSSSQTAAGKRRYDDWSGWYAADSASRVLAADPFLIHINDCHDCDAQAPQKIKYTRLDFVKRLVNLEESAAKDPAHAAQIYFELGNGYYNATYFGNARRFYQCSILNKGDWYGEYTKEEPYQDCSRALSYYKRALDLATDAEFKAKCCYMAAKCETNSYIRDNWSKIYSEVDFPIYKGGDYFYQLKTNYSQTAYYQEVIKECWYFRKYLNL